MDIRVESKEGTLKGQWKGKREKQRQEAELRLGPELEVERFERGRRFQRGREGAVSSINHYYGRDDLLVGSSFLAFMEFFNGKIPPPGSIGT